MFLDFLVIEVIQLNDYYYRLMLLIIEVIEVIQLDYFYSNLDLAAHLDLTLQVQLREFDAPADDREVRRELDPRVADPRRQYVANAPHDCLRIAGDPARPLEAAPTAGPGRESRRSRAAPGVAPAQCPLPRVRRPFASRAGSFRLERPRPRLGARRQICQIVSREAGPLGRCRTQSRADRQCPRRLGFRGEGRGAARRRRSSRPPSAGSPSRSTSSRGRPSPAPTAARRPWSADDDAALRGSLRACGSGDRSDRARRRAAAGGAPPRGSRASR